MRKCWVRKWSNIGCIKVMRKTALAWWVLWATIWTYPIVIISQIMSLYCRILLESSTCNSIHQVIIYSRTKGIMEWVNIIRWKRCWTNKWCGSRNKRITNSSCSNSRIRHNIKNKRIANNSCSNSSTRLSNNLDKCKRSLSKWCIIHNRWCSNSRRCYIHMS